ncbi:hypothetical protein [Lagierella sp.]|uniref:hypothetical protein n=1 Tax=Lagierella sp. TaxID=2849657 RepID=UPI002614F882|nr:hypothetical protein [Lagierella sp.]
MTIKRFLQNKIHICLLIISLILSIIVFTGEKYSLEDKEIDLYVGIEDNLNKVLSKSLSLRDYNALIYGENTDNDFDYLKEDENTIEEIEYYLTLNNIISEIIQSFSQEEIPASGFIEKVPAKKMNKPAFMKGQKELIDFYKSTRDKSYSLLEPGDMTFLAKRYDYLSNSKVEVLDENGKVYLNSIIARKSDYLFSAPILIIVSLIGAFVLKQDKIALKLKENLFVLKLKASLFYATIVLIFCTSIFLFLGLLSWIFGSGIGPFDYIYFNPQIID